MLNAEQFNVTSNSALRGRSHTIQLSKWMTFIFLFINLGGLMKTWKDVWEGLTTF